MSNNISHFKIERFIIKVLILKLYNCFNSFFFFIKIAILTPHRTFKRVSRCHLLFGAYLSAAKTIFEEQGALNSASAFSRNVTNSFIIVLIFCELTRAKESSIALLRIETSGSFKHSKMVVRCLCTAEVSTCTVLRRVFRAT